MVSAFSLWLPILLSAVFVFIASSIIHMALGYHAGDLQSVPDEEAARAAIGPLKLPPGDYGIPRPGSMKDLGSAAFKAKQAQGPVLFFTVRPNGDQGMGGPLAIWFVYSVVVAFVAAYVTGIAYGPGTAYPQIFRVAGTVGFAGFALGLPQHSIWYGRRWRTTLISMFDGLVYGGLIGGTLGWLWPR